MYQVLISFVTVIYLSILFQVSISFCHSLGTRVRLSLMRSVSKRQKLHDPESICSVTSFTARPLMRYEMFSILM